MAETILQNNTFKEFALHSTIKGQKAGKVVVGVRVGEQAAIGDTKGGRHKLALLELAKAGAHNILVRRGPHNEYVDVDVADAFEWHFHQEQYDGFMLTRKTDPEQNRILIGVEGSSASLDWPTVRRAREDTLSLLQQIVDQINQERQTEAAEIVIFEVNRKILSEE